MTQEKPGLWPLGHTLERAKQLAAEELRKQEEEKIKKNIKGNVIKIIQKK